ncbi:MAG: asparagine synthase (glutamine-hydrolyzing) [Bacteroidota bacterium]
MCGIAGHISLDKTINRALFLTMLDTLAHRGPDDSGIFINGSNNIALGHRRLSFLDLSEAGKQPLPGNDGNIQLTFNGEIYNYRELKEELKNEYAFKTETDTEVIIAAYIKWGIQCVNHLKGMFAFALLDQHQHKLFLVRDRFGIKPLYYHASSAQLLFASELKAIMASGLVEKQVDFSSLSDYFVYRYIPSPKTIWQHVAKVKPAHYLEFDTNTLAYTETEYWQIKEADGSENEQQLIEEINAILSNSVKEHIRADVPVGSFLSGGYDSSAMVYYMKSLGCDPQTFSIGFNNWEKSEHYYADIVAKHLGVENDAVIANENSLQLVDIMPEVYDEPFADISIVPTYMVSRLARSKVKAVLSGEGADEIFGGYTWQHDFYNLNNPGGLWNKLKQRLVPKDAVAFYANAMAMGWFDRHELKKLLHPDLHKHIADDVHWFYRGHYKKQLTSLKSIQYMDMKCFMGELVLTKIDRASMANSLEVRVPFLDHHLFEKIFSLSEKAYYKKDQTKFLLYENLKAHLPGEILERKKQGFVGPDSYYMNLDFYKEQLGNSNLVKYSIINQSYIDDLLNETYNWKLWKILVMEKWFSKWCV